MVFFPTMAQAVPGVSGWGTAVAEDQYGRPVMLVRLSAVLGPGGVVLSNGIALIHPGQYGWPAVHKMRKKAGEQGKAWGEGREG